MTTLSAADILRVDDKKLQQLEVPEWGGAVWIRTMTATERDAFEQEFVDLRQGKTKSGTVANVRAKFAARILCDGNGARLFEDKDIPELGRKSASALDRVFDAGMKLNGFSKADVEELAGNS